VLAVLPEAPTRADLDVAYAERGAGLVACEGARRLAVESLLAERALQDRWRADIARASKRRLRPW
jgi:hypothetical protein